MLSKKMADEVGFSFVAEKLECFSYYGAVKIREMNAAFVDSQKLSDYCGSINHAEIFYNISKLSELHEYQVESIQDLLSNFKNISGIIKKLEFVYLSEVELFEIKRFLRGLEKFIDLWNKVNFQLDGLHFIEMTVALNMLDPKNQRIAVFLIPDDYSPGLKAARQKKALIEALIDKHGMTDELIKKRATIAADEEKHEQAALEHLTNKLKPFVPSFKLNMENIGLLDFTLAKAVLASHAAAACPTISSHGLRLKNMWNPKTQEELKKKGRTFINISIELEPGSTVLIGANMGGKSLTIKTVLLNVLLANMGFFVFADLGDVPLFDDVFFIDEGAGNDFLSSFGAEVMQINEAVKNLAEKKLFIALDEPARTTNPAEGSKIVRGIVSYLAKQQSTSLISTHYGNVQENAGAVYQTASFSYDGLGSADADNLAKFIKYELRKVDANTTIPTEAINLCKILGMNPSLLAEIDI